MRLKSLYGSYFQKSKVFLFPLTGLKKIAEFRPEMSYLSLEGVHINSDMRLIVTYTIPKNKDKFYKYLNRVVKRSKCFEKHHLSSDGTTEVVIFDLRYFEEDLIKFYNGQYSTLSNTVKKKIVNYYGHSSSNWLYIESYLEPHMYFENYASLLNVDISILKEGGELCSEPNLDKEHLNIKLDERSVNVSDKSGEVVENDSTNK